MFLYLPEAPLSGQAFTIPTISISWWLSVPSLVTRMETGMGMELVQESLLLGHVRLATFKLAGTATTPGLLIMLVVRA